MDSFSTIRFPFRGWFFFLLVTALPNLFRANVQAVGPAWVKEPSVFRSSDPLFSFFAPSDGGTPKPAAHKVEQTCQEKWTRKSTGRSSPPPRPHSTGGSCRMHYPLIPGKALGRNVKVTGTALTLPVCEPVPSPFWALICSSVLNIRLGSGVGFEQL